jgi:CheY-like chemotaxis protein
MTIVVANTLVLIVEDDALVRMDTADMMGRLGFSVLEAKDACEAIRLLESHVDITVVFTDVEMPGSMNGLKLAWVVHGRWPPIKIIITSGKIKPPEDDLPEGGRFLSKPYTRIQVDNTLREMQHLH